MRFPLLFGGIALACSACGGPQSEEPEALGGSHQAIVNGSPSAANQDATVLVSDRGRAACSGTLIAPNLVLTARHCVSRYDENSECGTVISDLSASELTIAVGADADERTVTARGANLYVPSTNSLCSSDLALISLDKDVPNITPAKVRFAAPSKDATGTAVGYGGSRSRTARSDVKVLAVGPVDYSYRTRDGEQIPMDPLANEIVTTESTCFGDSGGPLLDDQGRVFAVASRGIDRVCADRPAFWTTLSGNEQLVRDAANAVGHPIVDAPAGTTTTPGKSSVTASGDSASGDADEASPGSTGSAKTKKTAAKTDPAADSGGCTIPRGRTSSPMAALAGIAIAALAIRRRSSPRPSSRR